MATDTEANLQSIPLDDSDSIYEPSCSCPNWALVVLCFFLPPCAVGIRVGFCRPPWIINFLLFIFGFIGAVIHGILTVLEKTPYTKRLAQRRRERDARIAARPQAQNA